MNTIKTKILGLSVLSAVTIMQAEAQQIRTVGDFSAIKATDAFNVLISQSEANTIKVNAPDNFQSQVKSEVKDGVLSIFSEGNIKTDKPIDIIIGIKSLTSLDVSGSADVKSENQLTCDKLTITSNGAGDVHLDLKANEIIADASGAGDIVLKGSTALLYASISGAGDLKASNLEATKIKAIVSGAGDAKVNATQSLDADVSGAGSIIYKGNPTDRNVNISGAGSVRESKSGNGEETASDTTKFKLGNKKYIIIGDGKRNEDAKAKNDSSKSRKDSFKHWYGLEVGINGIMDFKNNLDLPPNANFLELNYPKSLQFGINLAEKDFHIYRNCINIVTGFGFDFNHYALQNNVTLNGDTTYLNAWKDTSISYKKNKLNVSYIKIPLLLEFNTSENATKNFHIAVGGEFAYRIHSVTKQKFEENDKHIKIKQKDDFNLEPFRYSAVARIGYNNVTVFADYGLNRLFKKDKGPQVYPFTVGVTINM